MSKLPDDKLADELVVADGLAAKLRHVESAISLAVAARPGVAARSIESGGTDALIEFNTGVERLEAEREGLSELLRETEERIAGLRADIAKRDRDASLEREREHRQARDEAIVEGLQHVEALGAAVAVAGDEHRLMNLERVSRDGDARFDDWRPVVLQIEAALKWFCDARAGRFPLDLEHAAHLERPTLIRVLRIEPA